MRYLLVGPDMNLVHRLGKVGNVGQETADWVRPCTVNLQMK